MCTMYIINVYTKKWKEIDTKMEALRNALSEEQKVELERLLADTKQEGRDEPNG